MLKLNDIYFDPDMMYEEYTSWVGAVSRRLKVLEVVAASHGLKAICSNSGLQLKSCQRR